MRPPPLLLVAALALLGFAVFPACFWRQGSRQPPAPPPVPTVGPRQEVGGQRLPVPAIPEAVDRARAALEARGWLVHLSTRADELLGTRFANTAVLRWGPAGWWCRVDQRSDLATGARVPAWDHPWEALRLLHLAVPDAGPALGWRAWEEVPAVVAVDEAAFRNLMLKRKLPFALRLGAQTHLARNPLSAGLARQRLRVVLARATTAGDSGGPALLAWDREVEQYHSGVLHRAIAERRDPYTAFDPHLDFQQRWSRSGGPGSEADAHLAHLDLACRLARYRADQEGRFRLREADRELLTLMGLELPEHAIRGDQAALWDETIGPWLDRLLAEPAP